MVVVFHFCCCENGSGQMEIRYFYIGQEPAVNRRVDFSRNPNLVENVHNGVFFHSGNWAGESKSSCAFIDDDAAAFEDTADCCCWCC